MGFKLGWRLCASLALLLTAGCGSSGTQFLRHDIPQDSIKIGVKSDQPGTGWTPDGYAFSGFDIDVAKELGQALGFHDTLVAVPSQDRVTALTQSDAGEVDLVIATFSITQDRAHQIYFTGPYAKTYQGFLVRKNDSRIKTLADLHGKRACAWEGTNSLQVLQKQVPDVVAATTSTADQCVDELRSGQVDAVSTDQLILYGFAHQYPDLKVVPDLMIGAANYYGIGMAKHDQRGDSNLADCRRVRDALKGYVGSSAWKQDMGQDLPMFVADPQWMTLDRPSVADIDRLSCTDDLAD
jgi:glutamate transport system substrate-binding protein